MADNRRNDDDLQRNMGGTKGNEGQNFGQQSPGRSDQGQQGGQQAGGYGGSQQKPNFENEHDMEDDDLGAGNAQKGEQGRGGQNR